MNLALRQIGQNPTTPLPYIALGKFSLEDQNAAQLRTATNNLLARFPNDPNGHFFNGIQELQARNFKAAEVSLRKAKELGMPEQSINEYLKAAIDGQKWIWEYAYIVLWTLAAWFAGLLLFYAVGRTLSAATIASIRTGNSTPHGLWDRLLRRGYRLVITLFSLYYYVSLPMVIILAVALPLTIGYALCICPG